MATMIFGIGGSMLGGPVGGMLGAAVGSWIDNKLLFPALFKNTGEQKGGRRELMVQSGSEGSPIPRCFGPECFVTGTIIWIGSFVANQRESHEATYTLDLAIGLCEGDIIGISKIWMNGADVWHVATIENKTSTKLSVEKIGKTKMRIICSDTGLKLDEIFRPSKKPAQFLKVSGFANGGNNSTGFGFQIKKKGKTTSNNTTYLEVLNSNAVNEAEGATVVLRQEWGYTKCESDKISVTIKGSGANKKIELSSPSTGPHFGDYFESSKKSNFTITGFANPANNGTFKVVSVAKNRTSSDISKMSVANPDAVAEVAGASVTLEQVLEETNEYIVGGDPPTVHLGDQVTADTLIDEREGDAPAFKNLAYVRFSALRLNKFGGNIPKIDFLVKQSASISIGDVIKAILIYTGKFAADDIDVEGLDDSVTGYVIPGPTNTKDALAPLLIAFDILDQVSPDGETIRFFKRADATEYTIPWNDLSAMTPGANEERRLIVHDESGIDLPKEVLVQYVDPNDDYQVRVQRAQRVDSPATGSLSIDLQFLTLTADEALAIAHRELWSRWGSRQSVEFSLPMSYCYLRENDVAVVTAYGETWRILIKRVEIGVNGIIRISGNVLDTQTLDHDPTGDEVWNDPNPIPEATFALQVLDIPPLSDEDAVKIGAYMAGAYYDSEKPFGELDLYESMDSGNTYNLKTGILKEAQLGEALGVLASGPIGYWDRKNYVDVEVWEGTLSSKTEIEVLNGQNRAVLGTEIIGYQTATLLETGQYRLSTLLRGLRNTEDQVGTHVTGERFTIINREYFTWLDLNVGALGSTRYYKASGDEDLTDAEETSRTFALAMVKPFSPCFIRGSRDGSNNLTITWIPRTRGGHRVLSCLAVPLFETSESYEIDVMNGAAVVRTISVSGARTASYTAAQQTSDGLTPGNPVTVRIYQKSIVLDNRGNRGEATV